MNVAQFRTLMLSSLLAMACPSVAAQTAPVAGSVKAKVASVPAARPTDVSSIDGILDALYDVISGPKEQVRDWNRLRSLFAPGARVIPTHTNENGVTQAQVMSVEEFVALAGPTLAKEGFFERESHRVMQRYGAIAHIFSTYESRHAAKDAKPFQRGINSIQLLFDGHRWWVVTIYWQAERPDLAVPKQYGG
jgi:hypothetical protein